MKARMDAREKVMIPTYTLVKKRRKIPFIVPVIICFSAFLFGVIYLPPLLIAEQDTSLRPSVNLQASADRNALEWAQSYIRNNPQADFDGDGLTNEQEMSLGTGVYLIDNDFDGTTDFAELNFTESNPCYYDNAIETFVQQSDASTGNNVKTPFKVHDIVLWADDYESKARGSVIPLEDGSYNFYRFQGWAQFPPNIQYAYKVENGIQTALKKNANGYFYIDEKSLTNVRVYETQPQQCYVLTLMGEDRYMLPDNLGSRILDAILPGNGFGLITIKKALLNDLDGTWQETAKANPIVTLKADGYDVSRFGRNELSVADLSSVFYQIDSGNNVIISLMSHDVGETILEVYGYTNRNNLLVCDPRTGEIFGVINIDVIGERVLDQNGAISSYEHFEFVGCGYSSYARHRLMILDTVDASMDHAETIVDPNTESINDSSTVSSRALTSSEE